MHVRLGRGSARATRAARGDVARGARRARPCRRRVHDRDDLALARACTSCMLRQRLLVVRVARDDDHDRHLFVDERDGPVLHLAGRVALRVDVRDLLELERPLERDRVARAAPEEEHVLRAHVLLGEVRGRPSAFASTSRICCGASVSASSTRRASSGRERAAAPPEVDGEQEHGHELRREALGRGDANLRAPRACRARASLTRGIALSMTLATARTCAPLRLGGLHRGERVERLAALAHGDDEVVRRRRPARGSAPRCRSRRPPARARAARPSSARPSPRARSCRRRRSRRA